MPTLNVLQRLLMLEGAMSALTARTEAMERGVSTTKKLHGSRSRRWGRNTRSCGRCGSSSSGCSRVRRVQLSWHQQWWWKMQWSVESSGCSSCSVVVGLARAKIGIGVVGSNFGRSRTSTNSWGRSGCNGVVVVLTAIVGVVWLREQ